MRENSRSSTICHFEDEPGRRAFTEIFGDTKQGESLALLIIVHSNIAYPRLDNLGPRKIVSRNLCIEILINHMHYDFHFTTKNIVIPQFMFVLYR